MKPLALALALALVGCGSPDSVAPRALPSAPSLVTLTTDVTPAAMPTAVSADIFASVVRVDGSKVDSILVTWIDNETRLDEFVTGVQFETADGGPVTTQGSYATEYDLPAGSTGERSAVVIAPAGMAERARFWTARFFLIETLPGEFATMSKKSAATEFIAVSSSLVTVTTTKGHGRKR